MLPFYPKTVGLHQGSSFLMLAKKLPQYPVVPSLFTTRATLKLSASETLRPFPFSFLLVRVEVSFFLVFVDRDLLNAESCPHQPCPILKIPDLREILRDKLLERLVPELIAISMPSWGGHSSTTSPAATPLALEEVYIVTYSMPKLHFPLNLTFPLPLEVSFSLFCLFLSPVAKVPMWIMTKSARAESVSRNLRFSKEKGNDILLFSSFSEGLKSYKPSSS